MADHKISMSVFLGGVRVQLKQLGTVDTMYHNTIKQDETLLKKTVIRMKFYENKINVGGEIYRKKSP